MSRRGAVTLPTVYSAREFSWFIFNAGPRMLDNPKVKAGQHVQLGPAPIYLITYLEHKSSPIMPDRLWNLWERDTPFEMPSCSGFRSHPLGLGIPCRNSDMWLLYIDGAHHSMCEFAPYTGIFGRPICRLWKSTCTRAMRLGAVMDWRF